MPLTRIEIEEIGPGRWVAEVEAGGTSAVRRNVRAAGFDEIVAAVVEAHRDMVPALALVLGSVPAGTMGSDVPNVLERARAESDAIAAEVAARQEDEDEARQEDEGAVVFPHDALVREAQALGIAVDGRWGKRRLRDEIERAQNCG